MTDAPANRPAADAAAALAAAAGVAELAAAAEIDTVEGDGFLAALARHEIALGHQLAMQFAGAGNAALDAALAAGADAEAARSADRTAARLGGAVSRIMGNVRLTLLSRAAQPAASEERWVGVCFEGETLCSPEEAERRLAAAKAARAAAQGAPVSRSESERRLATPAQQERIAAARTAAAALAAEAGVSALAAEWDQAKRLLRHEIAAAHRLVMRFGGRAGQLLAQALPEDDRVEALRLAAAAVRLMARGRQAVAALPRLAPGPDGGAPVTGYYWIGERDLFGSQKPEDRGQKVPEFANESRPAAPAASGGTFCLPSSGFCLLNRGRLKNNNPSGDYLAAPRCGACTRAGHPCRQPAMKNGRCRFHGGKSTGPRTAEGLAASRAARRTHGGYSAEIIDLRKAAAAHARRVNALVALRNQKPEIRSQKASRADNRSTPAVLTLPAGTFWLLSSDFRVLNPAGHGVHPLFLMTPPRKRKAG